MFKFKKKNLISAAVCLSAIILLSICTPVLRSPFLGILELPLKLLTQAKREIGGIVFYHRNLARNEKLSKEIELLRYKLNDREEIFRENRRLKSILSFKRKAAFKVIPSGVIGRGAENWSSVIIIDKGKNQGIRNGMVAINHLGLAGRVVEAGPSTAKIILINDPDHNVSAIVQRSRQEGLVSGTLGSSLVMRYLTPESDIQAGDTVVTSGLTAAYPKGLLIGTVSSIGDEFSGLSRYAVVKPAVNLSALEEVLVIVP